MALEDLKFEEADFVGEDVASLPDQVASQAAFLKARMDNVAKNMIALGRFNQLIDALKPSSIKYSLGSDRLIGSAEGAVVLYLNNSIWSNGSHPPSYVGSGVFKINEAGKYRITVNIGFINGDASTDREIYLYKDSSSRICGVSTKSLANTGISAYASLSTEEDLAVDDTLEVRARVFGADSTVENFSANSISITKIFD